MASLRKRRAPGPSKATRAGTQILPTNKIGHCWEKRVRGVNRTPKKRKSPGEKRKEHKRGSRKNNSKNVGTATNKIAAGRRQKRNGGVERKRQRKWGEKDSKKPTAEHWEHLKKTKKSKKNGEKEGGTRPRSAVERKTVRGSAAWQEKKDGKENAQKKMKKRSKKGKRLLAETRTKGGRKSKGEADDLTWKRKKVVREPKTHK